MNKNNLFSSLTLLGLFVFSSCNLDLAPEDTLSPKTYFKNGPQLELWTNHFYSLFPDVDDLAKGLYWVLYEADYDALSREAVHKVVTNYSQHAVAMTYIEVYNEAIALKNFHL